MYKTQCHLRYKYVCNATVNKTPLYQSVYGRFAFQQSGLRTQVARPSKKDDRSWLISYTFTLQVCVQCYIQVVRKTLVSVYKQVMMSCTLLACINLLWVLAKTWKKIPCISPWTNHDVHISIWTVKGIVGWTVCMKWCWNFRKYMVAVVIWNNFSSHRKNTYMKYEK